MNHRDVMELLVRKHGWTRGVELGLASGQLFSRLLSTFPDLYMIGVDRSINPPRVAQVRAIAKTYAGRCEVHECLTWQAASRVEDRSVDFVFIDADHSYAGCKDDIERWMPKVRSGGLLCGHDYNPVWPGVIKAVDEAFGSKVEHHPDCVWSVKVERT